MPALQLPSATTHKNHWHSLEGSSKALAVCEAAAQYNGLTLLVTDSARSAQTIETALDFYKSPNQNGPILHFPDWETLPYDLFSPHQDIISERLRTLYNLASIKKGIVVISASTLMQRLVPVDFIQKNSFLWEKGQKLEIQHLRNQLQQCGYNSVETVYEHGEYAVRGSIIDVYPMGSTAPVRLDLFDNEIESIRLFDPENQLTQQQLDKIDLLPAKEIDLNASGIKRFKDNWHIQFDADPKKSNFYNDIASGIAPQGIEYYLPLFFDQTATLFDYLPDNCQLFYESNIEASAQHFWQDISQRFTEYNVDRQRPLLPPGKLFLDVPELFQQFGRFPQTCLHTQAVVKGHNFAIAKPDNLAIDQHNKNPLRQVELFLSQTNHRVLFCAESMGRKDTLEELLGRHHIRPKSFNDWTEFLTANDPLGICVHPIDCGLSIQSPAITLITETELFGQQVLQRRRRYKNKDHNDQIFKNLAELRIGAPVVHIDQGVGRYRGLITLTTGGEPQEFINIEYANQSKLYVPVASLQLISRYSSAEDSLAPLHSLGSEKWQKAKEKALNQLRDTAVELLDVYARRAAAKGVAINTEEADYQQFCVDFPFEETPDQLQAINAVKTDMEAPKPMDRLICGDVGFGKTEVAMRAAFLAVSAGKQVIMLVPTTLLAHQHTENFRDRFSSWPVRIEELSRFQTASEQQKTVAAVANGKVDILIGTHKLLNGKIRYKDLGLLIIDEEHRFGVSQKEKIKALRAEVDFLTLTATPIPRTLNQSLQGLRDLSIIATPPAKRLSVKTFVREYETRLIKEAILRELLRGGQVYYLHNDVKSIARITHELEQLVPEARVAFGHGQMRERELEQVMTDFYHQRYNVLVCTTIIENGIDIPTANTIIINRADKLGLAQLHQLRGRVGRSHHQAYAYLLTPHPKTITTDAIKRLEAIESADHLGSGFTLATHDMEIRGAGELLGAEQSGHIQAIGFTLYMELLDRAIKALRNGETLDTQLPFSQTTEVNLNLPALIPEDYLPDVHSRLIMYKRIANAEDEQSLRELQVEMIDRFGLLPEYLKNLFRQTSFKLTAENLGIVKVDCTTTQCRLEFAQNTCVEPIKIIQLVQQSPDRYQLKGASQLIFTAPTPLKTVEQRFETVQTLLDNLTSRH